MRILFDHNVPRRLREHLPEHDIRTAREMRWELLRNGALLTAAAEAGFETVITTDTHLEYEQNLMKVPLPIVVLDADSNALPALLPLTPFLRDLLTSPLHRALYVVQKPGEVVRLNEPRKR